MFLAHPTRITPAFDLLTTTTSSSPTQNLPLPLPATLLPHPLPTPTHGPSGNFTLACSTHIDATPEECMLVMLDTATYPSWNRFAPRMLVKKLPGEWDAPVPASLRGLVGREDVLVAGVHAEIEVHMGLDSRVTTRSPVVVSYLEEVEVEVGVGDGDGASSSPGLVGEGTTTGGAAAASAASSSEAQPKKPTTKRKGLRVAWCTGGLMPGFLLKAERVQEFISCADGKGCDYYCWETFYGGLAPVVRTGFGKKLEGGFQAWMDGLKEFVENGGKI